MLADGSDDSDVLSVLTSKHPQSKPNTAQANLHSFSSLPESLSEEQLHEMEGHVQGLAATADVPRDAATDVNAETHGSGSSPVHHNMVIPLPPLGPPWECIHCRQHIPGGHGAHRKRCAGCLCVWYCGRQCQAEDWPRHRMQCISVQERAFLKHTDPPLPDAVKGLIIEMFWRAPSAQTDDHKVAIARGSPSETYHEIASKSKAEEDGASA